MSTTHKDNNVKITKNKKKVHRQKIFNLEKLIKEDMKFWSRLWMNSKLGLITLIMEFKL